jgi:hypothetical protein
VRRGKEEGGEERSKGGRRGGENISILCDSYCMCVKAGLLSEALTSRVLCVDTINSKLNSCKHEKFIAF